MPKSDVVSVSKVFADVNKAAPKSYYEYEKYEFQTLKPDNYQIYRKIGKGKYSDVFLAKKMSDNSDIVIKSLKPVNKDKIRREILILTNLQNGPNVINFEGVVEVQGANIRSLIFEYIGSSTLRDLAFTLNACDIKHYTFELLKALHFCHSKGIMHRDVKPLNIVINEVQRRLRLIDWGLADFYHCEKKYNLRVGSRHYKPPELLVAMHYYDYSLDMWALGCTLGYMMFRVESMFRGEDNLDQLAKIVTFLGWPRLKEYLRKYQLDIDHDLKQKLLTCKGKPIACFINDKNRHLADLNGLDLMKKVLVYDHMDRLTALQALQHPYFSELYR